ncbi:hypothetical protein DUNSADRAFT_13085 [Dunaliella salina]|uniref:RNA-dependent RNA polymerase n=1 Tax=Dunaliella salina TaxID=3046 RepID=A0ABQ7H3J1_DUNSA|nr:hypothetical protein DUNSADRAFT_13085 [Dunaliella salina]|eukprot:KAF5841422.1 hypothetical protein DUNSADRAFT_13085 [Dunaliella salina]
MLMPAIRASRTSTCYRCNLPIQCNDWIVPDSAHQLARWVHSSCALGTGTQPNAKIVPEILPAYAPIVRQTGSDGTREAAVHRLFMELPFPFRLVLEQLHVMDTISASTLEAMKALTPNPDTWKAFERQLARDGAAASATTSGKNMGDVAIQKDSRKWPTGASLVQMLVEQKWVEWDSTHMRFRENPLPPSDPPYRQTAAMLLQDDVQGKPAIEVRLHAGNADTCSYLGRHSEVAAHHRLLWVKSLEGSEKAAEQLILNGLVLGGRQFHIMYFKFDRKASTLVFFATKDFWAPSTNPAQMHALPAMTVEAAVAKLGAVQYLWRQPGKMMERMGLFSSSTLPFPMPADYIHYVDDIAASNLDGSAQGSEIMTVSMQFGAAWLEIYWKAQNVQKI